MVVAVVFFYTFILIASLILLNLFVAVSGSKRAQPQVDALSTGRMAIEHVNKQVILDRMAEIEEANKNPIRPADFAEKWAACDPQV